VTKTGGTPFSVKLRESQQGGERRLFPRYSIVGTAEIWEQGYNFSNRGTVTDISLSGCYVQMLNPMAIGQKLRFILTLGKTTFEGDAVVVNQHPSLGMGIDFENLSSDQQKSLNACIQYAQDRQHAHEHPQESDVVSAGDIKAGRASVIVSRLQEWFHDHDLMTRDEFRKVLERTSAEDKDKFII
jgi:hypothetical protein